MQPSSTPKPPSPIETSWREDRAVAVALIEAAQIEALLLRRGLLLRQYNPGQPRVPAGNATGGQWTSGQSAGGGGGGFGLGLGEGGLAEFAPEGGAGIDIGEASDWSIRDENHASDGALIDQTVADLRGNTIQSEFRATHEAGAWDERHTVTTPDGNAMTFETEGRTQTIRDGGPDGEIVSRTVWTPGGPERDATVQQADFGLPPKAPGSLGIAGTLLFGLFSSRNGIDGQQAVMGFNARDYRPSERMIGGLDLGFVGKLKEHEVELACPRLPEVQDFADRAARAAGPSNQYPSMAVYGTDVHYRFKTFMDALNDPFFRAERSFLKEAADPTSRQDIYNGYPGSVRVDAYELRPDGTLCFYDLKAGRRGLSVPRADILVQAGYYGFRNIRRIIMTEVRPRR